MSDALLRPEQPGDADAIDRVLEAAFGRPDEALLVRRLRAAGALSLSWVALDAAGTVVGHLACSPVTVQGAAVPGLLGLAPLAVLPTHQRLGLGSSLVRSVLDAARGDGNRLVVVLGDPAFYRRFGFRPAAGLGLSYSHPAAADAFQALVLAPPLVRGLVAYHRAFAGL